MRNTDINVMMPKRLFASILVLLAMTTGSVAGEEGKMRRVELLGIPVKAVSFGNAHSVLAKSPGGEPGMFYMAYFLTKGCGSLVGYHPRTKESVTVKLESSGGYGCCVGADGAIYIGGARPGNMYRYSPGSDKAENLGGKQFGVKYMWATAASRDGKVYGACYPTCSVLEYDIAAKKLSDLGRVHDSASCARAICVDCLGKVWVGVGQDAHLMVLDPKSGERTDVLPRENWKNSYCYSLQASGKYVLAIVLFDATLLVFDAETRRVVGSVEKPDGSIWWMTVPGAPDGEAYLRTFPDCDLYHYNINKDKLTCVTRGLVRCEQVVEKRYAHGVIDQDYFLYDLREKRFLARHRLASAGDTDGMRILTLTNGPRGNIYGTSYMNHHFFHCNAETGDMTDLGRVMVRRGGQVAAIHTGFDGRIYMASYPLADLSVYDPGKAWKPGIEAESNPRELGPIGHGQYNVPAIALGPYGKIWVGTVPKYGSAPTGAFSCWDPATGKRKTWLDLVPSGAVRKIAVDAKYVYCAGGGVFFVWAPKEEKKLFEVKAEVFSLVAAPNGKVLGNRGDEMFVFDPVEMRIIKTFDSPIGQMKNMTVAPNGKVYGISKSAIAEIDPDTWQGHQIADRGGQMIAADKNSRIYFVKRGDARIYILQEKNR